MSTPMKTEIISVDQARDEGHTGWSAEYKSPEYHGKIPGYLRAFCVEVKKPDGSLHSSSSVFLDDYEDESMIILEDEFTKPNELGEMAELCLHHGNQLTGRIIFNGYYEEYYDTEEREECVRDVTHIVDRLWKQYNVQEV